MTIFWDVDTQEDFLNPNGKLYIDGAKDIRKNLAAITSHAIWNGYQISGSIDKHFGSTHFLDRETELQRNGGEFPDHCMDGTFGEKKIPETVMGRRMVYHPHLEKHIEHPVNHTLFKECLNSGKGDLFFEKQQFDPTSNPAVMTFLRELEVESVVLYGVATEYCVQHTALSFLQQGIECFIVEDAIAGVYKQEIETAIRTIVRNGGCFVSLNDVFKRWIE